MALAAVHILLLPEIRAALQYGQILDRMREALMAQVRGECDTPMPMHLDIEEQAAEVHIKSSYRRGGRYFALKIAGTFPRQGTGSGMMLLSSAETGAPVAFLADDGHLTDVRTAAVAAMVAKELGRQDRVIGILGTGIQARLQARLHAEVLPLERIVLWGRTPGHVEAARRELSEIAAVTVAVSPADVAALARLLITCTASREPLLQAADLRPGTHISAVGADSPGKRELDPAILRGASLLLVDSREQCRKLGELQHTPAEAERAIEIGAFCSAPVSFASGGITVADFTGLGVEDLYIAEYCYERCTR